MRGIDRTPPTPSRELGLPVGTRRRVVRETLSAMREVQRLALALYHYEKLGPEGIAEALQIPEQEVDSLLSSATAHVHALLRQGEEGEDHSSNRSLAA